MKPGWLKKRHSIPFWFLRYAHTPRKRDSCIDKGMRAKAKLGSGTYCIYLLDPMKLLDIISS